MLISTPLVLCVTVGSVLTIPTFFKVADSEYLEKQSDVLRLLKNVYQPSYYNDIVEYANDFEFKDQWNQWIKPEYAMEFYKYYTNNILKKDELFSVFRPNHLKQTIALFRTLYYSKDYDTFRRVAAWARQNVNADMFVYSLSVAVMQSNFTSGIILPRIYEIMPYKFFNSKTIYEAGQLKQVNKNNAIVKSNYEKQPTSYFTEDIGLSANNYYNHIFVPFWMPNEEISFNAHTRGEWFCFRYHQLLARYYLDRLSAGLGNIPDTPEEGYQSTLTYFNGEPFPDRPSGARIGSSNVPSYLRRLHDKVDSIFIEKGNGEEIFNKGDLETVGRALEGDANSPSSRYYGNLPILLGQTNFTNPSVLEHYETSLRDIAFFTNHKKVLRFYHKYQNYQGPYQNRDLNFTGVKILNVSVDTLVTYFDKFDSDLTSNLMLTKEEFHEDTVNIRARRQRLNQRPFNYTMIVSSSMDTKAFIKVFLGPKHHDLNANRLNFFEIERFAYKLETGENIITRSSTTNNHFASDGMSYKEFYKKVDSALKNGEEYKYSTVVHYYGFPQRYMLPKGTFKGMLFQMYFIVAPFRYTDDTFIGDFRVDPSYTLGYPLDRPIEFESDFKLDNSYFKDVVIYHKHN